MRQSDSWTGQNLREMFRAGTQLLKANVPVINALNVFPVPDGDTGTNMLLTMQTAIQEANICPDNDASAVAQAMAQGALMGARGNSGVILSQILRGLAQGLEGRNSFSGRDLADALVHSSILAYKAVSQPAEGTILTVARESSAAASEVSAGANDLIAILEAAVNEAKKSVTRTPSLLPVLQQSGVVDAGGQGLYVILEGALKCLKGEEITEKEIVPDVQTITFVAQTPPEEPTYGYCTEFLICSSGLDLDPIREKLKQMGESVLVVGDETTARIHVHTFDPGAAIGYGISLGTLQQIKVDNMEDQHRDFISAGAESPSQPSSGVSTVVVVSGEGLVQVFQSIGATVVVPGGETMNPSVQELLQAVESVSTAEVIILPNNPDILPAASQIKDFTKKRVAVVPSRTIPQGIGALMAFSDEADMGTNVETMAQGIAAIHTGAIATATRSMRYKSLKVEREQIIGFMDEELVVAADRVEEALRDLLQKMGAANSEILTIYYRAGIDRGEVKKLIEPLRPQYPHLEVEIVFGGQPHYDYLISVE